MYAPYSISEAAAAAGCTPAELRIWSDRYGWPTPMRCRNGYRIFAPYMVDQIRRVVAIRNGGVPISDIIRDGHPILPTYGKKRPRLPSAESLPRPATAEGRALVALVLSVAEAQSRDALLVVVDSNMARVHPSDRAVTRDAVDRIIAAKETHHA